MITTRTWENDYAVVIEVEGNEKLVLSQMSKLLHEFFQPQIRKSTADDTGCFKIVFEKATFGGVQINPSLGHLRGIAMTVYRNEKGNLSGYCEMSGPRSSPRVS